MEPSLWFKLHRKKTLELNLAFQIKIQREIMQTYFMIRTINDLFYLFIFLFTSHVKRSILIYQKKLNT